jgi:hypothetical protein
MSFQQSIEFLQLVRGLSCLRTGGIPIRSKFLLLAHRCLGTARKACHDLKVELHMLRQAAKQRRWA